MSKTQVPDTLIAHLAKRFPDDPIIEYAKAGDREKVFARLDELGTVDNEWNFFCECEDHDLEMEALRAKATAMTDTINRLVEHSEKKPRFMWPNTRRAYFEWRDALIEDVIKAAL